MRKLFYIAVFGGFLFVNLAVLPPRYARRSEVEVVKSQPMELMVRAPGALEAKASQTLKAEFDGPIEKKAFQEGDLVKKGQVLVVMGRDRIQLDYQNKKDAYLNAKADLARAKRDLVLQRTLFKKQAVAYSTVEDAQQKVTRSEQGLKAAQETFRVEEETWNSNEVKAPFSGTVVKDFIHDDAFIANTKEIVTIADVSEYKMRGRVEEMDFKSVHEGQTAEIRLQSLDTPLTGTVTQVGPALEGTGLPEAPVVVRLRDASKYSLHPGMVGEVRIHLGTTEPIVSVPKTAIANTDGENRVWVVDWMHRLRARPVQLGRMNPDRTEITRGLAPRESICKSAEPDFSEGMQIIVGSTSTVSGMPPTYRLMKKRPS